MYTRDLRLLKHFPIEGDEIRSGMEIDEMIWLAQFDDRVTVLDKELNIVKVMAIKDQVKKFMRIGKDFVLGGSLGGLVHVI